MADQHGQFLKPFRSYRLSRGTSGSLLRRIYVDYLINGIGVVAAICSMASFVPQAWRIIKTRDTGSIAPATYMLTVVGFAAWIAYGAFLGSWPLIGSNTICFVLSGFILLMTILPARAKEAVAEKISGGGE
jgi:MtN3 and saliva related transmembrane protein